MILISTEASNEELLEAIKIRFSAVFGALNMANSFGGYQSNVWRIVRKYSPQELLDEADARKLDLSDVQCAVEGGPLVECVMYRRLRGV